MSDDYPIKVSLSREYTLHNRSYSTIFMREPRWPDYLAIGDVEQWMYRDGGISFKADLLDNISAYANRLCQDSGELVILDLVDTMAVEATIKGFFTKARASLMLRTSSSGDSGGDTQTSAG